MGIGLDEGDSRRLAGGAGLGTGDAAGIDHQLADLAHADMAAEFDCLLETWMANADAPTYLHASIGR
jgi:hypothetical protein